MKKTNTFLVLLMILACLFINKHDVSAQTKEETLTVTNFTLNKTTFFSGETLSYSCDVNSTIGSRYQIYSSVTIRYADGTLYQINNIPYSYNITSISGTYTLPSKIGGATISIQVSKYDGVIYQYPAPVTLSKNITINTPESLSISNATLNSTEYSPGQILTYSYKVTGNLITGAQIWSDVKIVYADGTSSQLINQSYSSYNNTFSGTFTLPAKYGAAKLYIKVNKYYNSTIQTSPSASSYKSFTIGEAGTATISDIEYQNSYTSSSSLYIYYNEGINVWLDLANTGDFNVDLVVLNIWTPNYVTESEMISNNKINPLYFDRPYYNPEENYENFLLSGESVSAALYSGIGLMCYTTGNYILWTFSCNSNDYKILDFEKVSFYYNSNSRPKKKPIIPTVSKSSGNSNEFINDFNELEVYPNPSQGILNFSLPMELDNSYNLSVFSTSGELIYTEENKNNGTNTLELHNITNGTYFIRINYNSKIYTSKISIQK